MTTAIIVDGSVDFCKSLSRYFEDDADLTITDAFQNLENAFNHLKTKQPNILLIDAKLLDKEGQEIIQIIKTNYPKIKCILLTSFVDNDNYKRALHLELSGYLTKGNDPEILKSEILKYLD